MDRFIELILLLILWLGGAALALFVMAVIVFIIAYYWTLGRHSALRRALQDHQKKPAREVKDHGT